MTSRTIDGFAARGEGVILLLGRLVIAALFVPSGFSKLMNLAGFGQMLAGKGLPVPIAWAVAAALIEFLGGLALAIGFKTRYVAVLLIVFTVVATLLAHAFWMISDPGARFVQQVNFFKNLAIIGGLLYVFQRGAGPISIDRR
jgi:putative oxidoreductase